MFTAAVKTARLINKKAKYGRDQNESGVLDARKSASVLGIKWSRLSKWRFRRRAQSGWKPLQCFLQTRQGSGPPALLLLKRRDFGVEQGRGRHRRSWL